jgi:glutamate synthase (NADPH/NADH) small chain
MYKEYGLNLRNTKNPMPSQDPKVRAHNFKEVAEGYTREMAIDEAKRCLGCPNKPCVAHCPVNIDIPAFIHQVALGNFEEAYQIITQTSSLPAVCGRVCPQETQCEMKCTRGIGVDPKTKQPKQAVAIGRLERFVADRHRNNVKEVAKKPTPNGHKVAVIGSGPSGLTCAGDLAKKGYDVTVFEALHLAGGVLVYGIPEFRLPKSIVQQEIDGLKALGVKVETNMVIGRIVTIDELLGEYHFEAVFVGTGAGLPRFLGIPGENLKGVYSANEYLTRSNLMKAYFPDSETPIEHAKNVAVVGGGNVAMDAARSALRLGAEHVYIVYRRSMEELPARKEEVGHAEEEGVEFRLLRNPVEIFGDPETHLVDKMKVEVMELGAPDAKGRRSPVGTGNYEEIDVDCVIIAIGTSPNPLIKQTTEGLETNPHGCIITTNEGGLTTRNNVYAGGDAVTGAATVILAMGAGKAAAKAIDEQIVGK